MKRLSIIIPLLCSVLTLTGCGRTSTSSPVDFDKNHVAFSGPNSITYEKAYNFTQSDVVRRILIDEHITDAEFDQVRQMYADCLGEKGATVEYEGTDGRRSERFPPGVSVDQIDEYIQECVADTALPYVEQLHQLDGQDPDSDSVEALVACLKRHDIADQTMTADDYKRIVTDPDLDDEYFGKYFNEQRPDYDAEKSPAYWSCNANPNA